MPEMTKEQKAKGSLEILLLGTKIDDDMMELVKMQVQWAQAVAAKFDLSPEGFTMLCHTAPSLNDIAQHAARHHVAGHCDTELNND